MRAKPCCGSQNRSPAMEILFEGEWASSNCNIPEEEMKWNTLCPDWMELADNWIRRCDSRLGHSLQGTIRLSTRKRTVAVR
jgi:hypothetical protein